MRFISLLCNFLFLIFGTLTYQVTRLLHLRDIVAAPVPVDNLPLAMTIVWNIDGTVLSRLTGTHHRVDS